MIYRQIVSAIMLSSRHCSRVIFQRLSIMLIVRDKGNDNLAYRQEKRVTPYRSHTFIHL